MTESCMMTTIIIPKKLNKKIILMAKERGMSRNSLMMYLLMEFVKENEGEK